MLVVEHRSPAGHLQAMLDLDTATRVLAGWVAASPGFGDGVSWSPV